MRLEEVWVRFYKSFNFDYELRARNPENRPTWQNTGDGWMPHVRIRLEPDITAVVGSNESGKTHLLDAAHILLFSKPLERTDFCRYSSLFSVERGARLYPDIGGRFSPNEKEAAELKAAGIPLQNNGTLLVFRTEAGLAVVAGSERVDLEEAAASVIKRFLPHPRELRTDLALPDSVSIAALAGRDGFKDRETRLGVLSMLRAVSAAEQLQPKIAELMTLLTVADKVETTEQRLGRLLLTKIANIDEQSFADLMDAIRDEKEGLVNGLIQEMNASIARHLNIGRWWTQDSDFQLRVSPREHELVFTIRDRTGTDYSFSERSRGLTFFLSYYVQLLSEDPPSGKSEVLLMDEPDAYLSASGQQDLLRVLEHHARPEHSNRADQVVYVTHSPFLINRNAGHRVRVVDKGSRDEGTRLVKDATQNHYEPLRTSLGAFVAETAFIGGDNLFVEGIADQVLLAGVNARLLRGGMAPRECLDLNQVTIVPSGSSIPYMVFLARGRDKIKPACTVLLDGDGSGKTAQKQLKRGGPHHKQVLAENYVVMLDEWAKQAGITGPEGIAVEETEDLIPIPVMVEACRRFAQRLLGEPEDKLKEFIEKSIKDELARRNSMWDATEAAFEAVFDTRPTKAGVAKEAIAFYNECATSKPRPAGLPEFERNFATLITHLAEVMTRARDAEDDTRREDRVERLVSAFLEDHPGGCTRDKAASVLARIDAAADNSDHGDEVRAHTARMRRQFHLNIDPLDNVSNYDSFLDEVKAIRYVSRLKHQDQASGNGRPGVVANTPPKAQPKRSARKAATSSPTSEQAAAAAEPLPDVSDARAT